MYFSVTITVCRVDGLFCCNMELNKTGTSANYYGGNNVPIHNVWPN